MGSISAPFWGDFRGTFWVKNASTRQALILHPFRSHFGYMFCTILETFWCHSGKISGADTASVGIPKSYKNHKFFNDFRMPVVSDGNQKPSPGDASPGFPANGQNDTKIVANWTPKCCLNWSQNGIRHDLKFALVFEPRKGPKLASTWTPNGTPKWVMKGGKSVQKQCSGLGAPKFTT